MRPSKEKARQSDRGFNFVQIWKQLGEESPAKVRGDGKQLELEVGRELTGPGEEGEPRQN